MNKETKKVLNVILLAVIFVSTCFLFWHYAISDGSLYLSDLPAHIYSGITGTGYSLMSDIFRLLYTVYPHNISIAVGLAGITVSTVFASAYFMKVISARMGIESDISQWIVLSSSALFITSIYIPYFYPYFYIGVLTTQPWHNSTYLLMRLFGTFVMALYFQIESHYLMVIEWKEWIIFTMLLTLVNYAKPNFILGFAPMMLIFLISDFIRQKGRGTFQMVKFGTCVLCSLWVLVFQYRILYPAEGDSRIEITFAVVKEIFSSPISIVTIFMGLAFPILVLCISIKLHDLSSVLLKCWVMYIVTYIETVFLTETGYRAGHGNFGWGAKTGAFILFLASCASLISLYKKGSIGKKVYTFSWMVYAASVGSGIAYFYILLRGGGFGI